MDADAIVIGAGAAGLSAARRLAADGINSIIVEARNRVGGRVLEASKGSVSAELGAEFIHGNAPETRALLHEIGQAEVEPDGDDWVRGADGELQPSEDEFRAAVSLFDKVATLEHDESVERFLARFLNGSVPRYQLRDAQTFVEGFDAADPAKASARGIAFEWDSGVDSRTARPLGGYRPLFEHLHRVCVEAGIRFQFSSPVTRVEWQRGSVSVSVRGSAGEDRILRARAAIITLPAGVLRHRGDADEIVFAPQLPPAKREGLEKIETGDVVKVALWFASRFWENIQDGRFRDAGFFRAFNATFHAYWTQSPLRQPVIVAWVGGPGATVLRRQSADVIAAQALEGLGSLLGDRLRAHDEFEGAMMHDWGGDPFARGAYSYLAVDGERARRQLAEPVDDSLFFAGEATAEDGQGGTVNGALATGERAAREVAESFAANRRP